jgi:hypothetical protein
LTNLAVRTLVPRLEDVSTGPVARLVQALQVVEVNLLKQAVLDAHFLGRAVVARTAVTVVVPTAAAAVSVVAAVSVIVMMPVRHLDFPKHTNYTVSSEM